MKTAFSQGATALAPSRVGTPVRRTVVTRVLEAVQALALCHNVTPVYDDDKSEETALQAEADQQSHQTVVYQASSPDEVLILMKRTLPVLNEMALIFVALFMV